MLQRLWRTGMHDEADVGSIDAHPEGDRRDDDVDVLVEEGILVVVPRSVVEAGVIRTRTIARLGQPRRMRVDVLARGAVDDARLAAMSFEHVEDLALDRASRQHTVEQIGPIE